MAHIQHAGFDSLEIAARGGRIGTMPGESPLNMMQRAPASAPVSRRRRPAAPPAMAGRAAGLRRHRAGGGLVWAVVLRRRHRRPHHVRLDGARSRRRPGLYLRQPNHQRLSVPHRSGLRDGRRHDQQHPAAVCRQRQGRQRRRAGLSSDHAGRRRHRPAHRRRARPAAEFCRQLVARAGQRERAAAGARQRFRHARSPARRSDRRRQRHHDYSPPTTPNSTAASSAARPPTIR